jgi:hypothetical protein
VDANGCDDDTFFGVLQGLVELYDLFWRRILPNLMAMLYPLQVIYIKMC